MAEAAVLDILGSGAGGPLSPPTAWIQHPGFVSYDGGVLIGNASGLNMGYGMMNAKGYYIEGVKVDLALYLPLAGGTLMGPLNLNGAPTAALHPATKQYVDQATGTLSGTFANYLLLAGGTLTGALTLSGAPTADLHASTKKYVDDKLAGIIGIADAPNDGITYGRKNNGWIDSGLIDMGTF